MLFERQELRDVIWAALRTALNSGMSTGAVCRFLSSSEALTLDLDLFVGIGNRRRIKFLRGRTQKFAANAGSHTTQRLKGESGMNIAHPLIQEHRSVRG